MVVAQAPFVSHLRILRTTKCDGCASTFCFTPSQENTSYYSRYVFAWPGTWCTAVHKLHKKPQNARQGICTFAVRSYYSSCIRCDCLRTSLIPGRHHGGASYVESCIGPTIRCPQTVPRQTNNCSISYLVSHTCTRRSRQKQPNHRILDTCRVRTTHKPLSTKHPSRSATWCHQLPGTVRGLMKRNKPQTHSSSRETCRDVERQLPAVRTSYLQFIATDNPMHHARKLCPLRPSNSRLHSSFTTSTSSTAAASRCV